MKYYHIVDKQNIYNPMLKQHLVPDYPIFPILKKLERKMPFCSRSWNEELIHKYLLQLDENRIIECMTIEHYFASELKDITFEISNMYSCPIGCTFCASGSLPQTIKHLSKEDYLGQIFTCILDRRYDIDSIKNVYVSFAGVGDPSLVYKDVSEGMYLIDKIIPNVRYNIATTGIMLDCFEYWNTYNHSIRTLQLPCFAITNDLKKILFRNIHSDYDLEKVVNYALIYKKCHPSCHVKMNYIVIQGLNDSDEYISTLIDAFSNYKENISIKVSYLNETIQSKKLGFKSPSPQRMVEIINRLSSVGFDCYVFGTIQNTNLGCGQLIQQIHLK